MATEPRVFVFRCGKCGLEYFSLRPSKPHAACLRCGYGSMPRRVITRPADKTFALAVREDAARLSA